MGDHWVKIRGKAFEAGGEEILLRGFCLGTWMNLEHFMLGVPGTNSMIKEAFAEVFGEGTAAKFWDRYLKGFADERDFAYMKSLGVNSLRIPFNYKYFLDDQHPETIKEEGFVYLDRIVELCAAHDIYAILDMHAAPGGQNPDWHCDTTSGLPLFWSYGALRDSAIRVWKAIADRYKDQPWIAGYDLVNEPSLVKDAAAFNDFYRKAIAEIREVDPNHIIFVSGNAFTTDFSMVEAHEDPLVAYTFHFYPFVENPAVLSPEMAREERKRLFSEEFEKLAAIRDKYDRPVWCGEFGLVWEREQIAHQVEIMEDMLELMERHDISWSLWTYKDAEVMGIVYPREDTPWQLFTGEIRKEWNQHEEQAKGEKLVDYMASEYFRPIDDTLRYPLQFRMRTIMQAICVEQHLKPHLRKLSVDALMKLADSFSFDQCGSWPELERLVKGITLGEKMM